MPKDWDLFDPNYFLFKDQESDLLNVSSIRKGIPEKGNSPNLVIKDKDHISIK